MMGTRVLCLTPLLLLVLCVAMSDAAQLQDTNFALTFRVQKDEFDKALEETKELLAFAEEKKMTPNTIMFIRTARDKVVGALQDLVKRNEEELKAEERKKSTSPPPTSLTNLKDEGVRSMRSEGAKKCNIKKHTLADFASLVNNGKLDMRKPFIVTGAMPEFDALRRAFTSEILMENTQIELKYLSPVKAKEKRSFDKQDTQVQDDEQLEYSLVTMEKYFINCFNHKAKPDFRKSGGADTEHCEQTVAAALLFNGSIPQADGIGGHLDFLQRLEPARDEFASYAGELQAFVTSKLDIKQSLTRSSSKFFTFGPAGSGEQLRQEGHPFADALVHGKRRWFLMAPKDFSALREKAKDVLEPASAFMFFEQQKEELEEEHGLGGKKMKFWECNQNPGEIIYIPGDTIMTSLSMVDSFSYKQHIATSLTSVLERVNGNIWAPESGMIPTGYQLAACFPHVDLNAAGSMLGSSLNPMQGQIIGQIMGQYYPSVIARNTLIINVLAECYAVLHTPGMEGKQTACGVAWEQCAGQLARNADTVGAKMPSWLSTKPTRAPKKEL
mmetsp:Transcript_10800/g.21684  ORF Transcript_10800/g.21684 Transcript_10800/m.21684 type:complete len:556 (+) Transcript_10800:80-1747(+)